MCYLLEKYNQKMFCHGSCRIVFIAPQKYNFYYRLMHILLKNQRKQEKNLKFR